MTQRDYFSYLIGYHITTQRRIWKSIDQITDDQFLADIDYSIGSIRNHVVHLAGVEERWLARMKGIPVPPVPAYTDFMTRESAFQRWEPISLALQSYIDSLSPDLLDVVIEFDMPNRGGLRTSTRARILTQIINHGTDHRAQILPILKRFNAPTFEQDYILYTWE